MVAPIDWNSLKSLSGVIPDHVVFRVFVSETVLLNIETGKYYGLDEAGARFLEAMRKSSSMENALGALLKEFDAPENRIREDLIRFCAELVPLGLIELR